MPEIRPIAVVYIAVSDMDQFVVLKYLL